MYHKKVQMEISDFFFPYGTLEINNRWVQLASLIPWDILDERYSKNFVENGHPAHSARCAYGALILKQFLKCSDEELVENVKENPYLQFFIGEKEYNFSCPFGASTLVSFRKRISEDDISILIEATISQKKNDIDEPYPTEENKGELLLDATCCPANIKYPQDIQLLNEAREKCEEIIDQICKENGFSKPRMRRRQARRDFLNVSKSKKRTAKKMRKAVKKQLNYLKNDLSFVVDFVLNGLELSENHLELLNILTILYQQQQYMFQNRTHSVPNRIVSISQPWVRPIVRGKAHANTEFGAKLHISLVDGYARILHLDFNPYHESEDFESAVESYKTLYGYYPARILADKAYRSRKALKYCKERNIVMSGPKLGKPSKNVEISKQQKKEEYNDICKRNAVEGCFGTVKNRYGLACIMARLENTSKTVIAIGLLCFNLQKRLKEVFVFFWKIPCCPIFFYDLRLRSSL